MTPKNGVSTRVGLLVSLAVFCLLYLAFDVSAQAQVPVPTPNGWTPLLQPASDGALRGSSVAPVSISLAQARLPPSP